jgi:hypothetical protein
MQCYQGQAPVRETVIDVFFLLLFIEIQCWKNSIFQFPSDSPDITNVMYIHIVLFFSENDGALIELYPPQRILNPRATHIAF